MKPNGTQLIAEFIYCSEGVLNNREELETILKSGIERSGFTLINLHSHSFQPVGQTVVAIIGESHIAIHTYPEARHASIDIFTCSTSEAQIRLLEFLKARLRPKTVRTLEMKRGNPIEIANPDCISEFSTKGFDVRYHVAQLLYSRQSRYQRIDIIENENFGRMLFLDHDLQISEKDAAIYNRCLVDPLIEKSSFNRVAILGGGDGGVLHELLKHHPREVFLVEIDEEVIRASETYLGSICQNAFRQPEVTVVIDDVNHFLEGYHGFDAVLYDLTMHPEALTRTDRTVFLRELFGKVRGNLVDGGWISLQCGSEFDTETLNLLREILPEYFTGLRFRSVFIPSFCEPWVFATAEAG